MVRLESLEDVLAHKVNMLRDTASVTMDALPEMIDAAHSPELKEEFHLQLRQSRQQLARLDEVMDILGYSAADVPCNAMRAIVEEAQEVLDSPGDPDVKDSALIAAAQSIEHYEIACYGTARTFAHELGYDQAAELLQETLNQEGDTDKKLTRLAEGSLFTGGINAEAVRKSRDSAAHK
jgi:ferritin-like metal-binding protein YciE